MAFAPIVTKMFVLISGSRKGNKKGLLTMFDKKKEAFLLKSAYFCDKLKIYCQVRWQKRGCYGS